MYKIIGADGREYGPESADQLRQWIAEGRVNGETQAQAEGGTDWKPLASFPEFAHLISAPPSAPPPFPTSAACASLLTPEELLARDYSLDIGSCVSRAWTLVTQNFGMIVGGSAVFIFVQIGINLLAKIPILGILISLASLFIGGPLMGGLYYFLLKNIRKEPVEIGDVFCGFRLCFVQLMLTQIVMLLIMLAGAIPGAVITAIPVYSMVKQHQPDAFHLALAVIGSLILMIPCIYFSTIWIFSLPLVIDRQMEFWPAMELSRKTVSKHWWMVFALAIVVALATICGLLACCIGVFVSAPIAWLALMYAYEDIFCRRTG